ncbi:hypothetical protein NVS55_28260 [Myxococcus stipitatus]|uniref:hypothetical protein n=1 Tax=Myxococcus stipitatus TaxID=83455 RepID=UPI003144F3FF
MSMRGLGDGGAAHVRRRQAEATQRGTEPRQDDASTARPARGFSSTSTFDNKATKPGGRLDGQAPASSLLTENSKDATVNCLDRAADWVSKASPELRGRSELVFLKDTRGGAEGQAGHVVVRQGERVFDPSSGKSYSDMQTYLKEQSQYQEVGSLSANTAAKVFATEPGSAERAQALAQAKLSPGLQQMMLADSTPLDAAVAATAGPEYNVSVPYQKGPVAVELSSSLSKDVKREDGYVTFNVSAEVAATVTGEVELKLARVSASASVGVTGGASMNYEVKMKEEDFAKLERGEIPPPHPLREETIPDGATIEVETGQFAGVTSTLELSGGKSSKVDGALSSTSTETVGTGTSIEVSRTGDLLTVTEGPTEFINQDAALTLGNDWVSASFGSSTSLKEYSLRSARFDLGNDSGKAAYESFSKGGGMPAQDGPGVSNTMRQDKLSWEGAFSKFSLNVEPFPTLESEGVKDATEFVVTHNSDGTKTLTASASFGDADRPELNYTAKYDKDGTLVPGSDSMSLVFDTTDDNARERLVMAFTGDAAKAKAARENDNPLTLTLSASDIQSMQARVGADSNSKLSSLLKDYDNSPASQGLAMLNMAKGLGNEIDVASEYWNLVTTSGGTPLSGTVV